MGRGRSTSRTCSQRFPTPRTPSSSGCPAGTTMGHVHLRIADVDEAVGFYRDLLGFDLTAQLGAQAAFLSAGGYHHHLGGNTWESRGAAQAPDGDGAVALLHDRAAR